MTSPTLEEYRQQMAHLLDDIAAVSRGVADGAGWEGADGSRMEGAGRKRAYATGVGLANALWQNLRATATLLREPEPLGAAACATARAACDIATRLWWMFDPSVSDQEHVNRAMHLWHKALTAPYKIENQAKAAGAPAAAELAKVAGAITVVHQHLRARLEEEGVAYEADEGGRVTKTDFSGPPIKTAGHLLPDVLEPFQLDFPAGAEAAVYAMLAGQSHGDPWQAAELLAPTGMAAPPGRVMLETSLNAEVGRAIMVASAGPAVAAWARWADLAGWEAWPPPRDEFAVRLRNLAATTPSHH